MNNGFTPASYAEIMRVYGPELRKVAPAAKIMACGQKRSADMEWSETVIDLTGEHFDVLGCHDVDTVDATVTVHSISAAPGTVATLEHPDAYPVQTRTMPFTRDLTVDLAPYSMVVVEVAAS